MAIEGTDDIVQNIVLAGADEVVTGFNSISKAGVLAAQAIGEAFSNINISSFVGALEGAAGAIAVTTAALFELSKASAQGVATLDRMAQAEGTSIENLSAFVGGLSAAGGSVDNLTISMRQFALHIGEVWQTVQKSTRTATTDMAAAENTVKEATTALAQALVDATFKAQFLAQQLKQDVVDVTSANISLEEAHLNLRSAREADDGSIQSSINIRKARLAIQQAELNLADAQIKAQKAQADAEFQKERQAEELAALQIRRDQAIQAQAELAGNSIANLKKFIDDTAAGLDTSNQKIILSEQNVVKGLIASVGPAANAITGVTNVLGDFGAEAPRMFPLILKLSAVFQNLGDTTTRQAVATAIFGRSFNQNILEVLSLGPAAIKAFSDQLTKLGFIFTDLDVAVERKFRVSLGLLSTELTILGRQLGEVFSPFFANVLDTIREAVERNRAAILVWAQDLFRVVQPIVLAFLNVLTGLDFSKNQRLLPSQIISLQEWTTTFQNLKTIIVSTFNDIKTFFLVTLPLIKATIDTLITPFTDLINTLTGLNLSNTQVEIILLIGLFSGVGNAIISILTLFALLAVAGPAAIAGVVTAVGFLIGVLLEISLGRVIAEFSDAWDRIKAKWDVSPFEGFKQAWEEIKNLANTLTLLPPIAISIAFWSGLIEGARLAFGDIQNIANAVWPNIVAVAQIQLQILSNLIGTILGRQVWDTVISGVVSAWNTISNTISGVINFLAGLWAKAFPAPQAPPSNQAIAGTTDGPSGFADGGLFRGKGGVDTNLAWLTDFEFVINPAMTKKWLGVLRAINADQFRLPGFSMGGLASGLNRHMTSSFIPAYAGGGLNLSPGKVPPTALRPLQLVLGGQLFDGFFGPVDLVDELERKAVLDIAASGGKTPRWR